MESSAVCTASPRLRQARLLVTMASHRFWRCCSTFQRLNPGASLASLTATTIHPLSDPLVVAT